MPARQFSSGRNLSTWIQSSVGDHDVPHTVDTVQAYFFLVLLAANKVVIFFGAYQSIGIYGVSLAAARDKLLFKVVANICELYFDLPRNRGIKQFYDPKDPAVRGVYARLRQGQVLKFFPVIDAQVQLQSFNEVRGMSRGNVGKE